MAVIKKDDVEQTGEWTIMASDTFSLLLNPICMTCNTPAYARK